MIALKNYGDFQNTSTTVSTVFFATAAVMQKVKLQNQKDTGWVQQHEHEWHKKFLSDYDNLDNVCTVISALPGDCGYTAYITKNLAQK